MKCLILAGGFGTRLYPLTINQAKALIQYKDKPLITHIIDKVPTNVDILVSINKKFEASFLQWQESLNRRVEICVEAVWTEGQRKGAVSSLDYWIERKHITEELLVIASDNYFEFELTEFIVSYDGKNTLVAVYDIGDKSRASQFGVVRLDGHRIIELEEKPAEPKSSLIATACYVFPPRIFPLLSKYCSQGKRDNLGSFIANLITVDEVHSYAFTEFWIDIGTAESLV
jgi:glucose-1-phosphate thymidylyltransferase